jgi:hypothetical protein
MALRLSMILAAAVALFAFVAYYNNQRKERFDAPAGGAMMAPMAPMPPSQLAPAQMQMPTQMQRSVGPPQASADVNGSSAALRSAAFAPNAMEPTGNEKYRPIPGVTGPSTPCDPFPQDRITPEQLLPKDAANSTWAQANPAGQGDVKDQNLLTAGFHIGFNTQGNSLRNASHDFRSTPPNPRFRVSIWNQSNIEPDLNRRPIE